MSHWVEGRRDAEMNASNLELTLYKSLEQIERAAPFKLCQ